MSSSSRGGRLLSPGFAQDCRNSPGAVATSASWDERIQILSRGPERRREFRRQVLPHKKAATMSEEAEERKVIGRRLPGPTRRRSSSSSSIRRSCNGGAGPGSPLLSWLRHLVPRSAASTAAPPCSKALSTARLTNSSGFGSQQTFLATWSGKVIVSFMVLLPKRSLP
jgi:hypothetical protein